MIEAQVVKGTKGYAYDIHPSNGNSHRLDFNPVLNYHGLLENKSWLLYHYNKFVKCWGVVDGSTGEYKFSDEETYALPSNVVGYLLPDEYLPNVKVRAVMIVRTQTGSTLPVNSR